MLQQNVALFFSFDHLPKNTVTVYKVINQMVHVQVPFSQLQLYSTQGCLAPLLVIREIMLSLLYMILTSP